MVTAVLFDLDDTLFDHRHAAKSVLEKLRQRYDALRRFPLEVLEAEDFRLLQEKHQLVLAGSLTIDEARVIRVRALFEGCGQRLSDEEAHDVAAQRAAIYRQSRQPVPGAKALLEAIHTRAKIGIVTNNMTEEQRGKMTACGFDSLVDLLITSEDAGCTKPSPEIFRAALEGLGCEAENAMMIGDVWDVDVAGARNAGIRPVWFNRYKEPKPAADDVVEIVSLETSYLQQHPSRIFNHILDPL